MICRLCLSFFFAAAVVGRAQDTAGPAVADFASVAEGRYQVLAQSGHQMALQVNLFMNEMLRQYEKYFNNWTLKAGARVIVFDNVTDFRRYASDKVGPSHAGLEGYCQAKTDKDGTRSYELVAYQETTLWRVLAHEGFHQFIGYELGRQIPTWLNEGMAQYFETSFVTGTRFNVGQVSRYKLLQAQALIAGKQAPPLGRLMQWDQATFYANADVAYPLSWALVHYLLNATGDRTEQRQFRRYLQDLTLGGDDTVRFQNSSGKDSARWQADFEEYILHLNTQAY